MVVAGHLIEQCIEKMRTDIAIDSTNFPPPADSTFSDSASGIVINCTFEVPSPDPTGKTAGSANVAKADFYALDSGSSDTLLVVNTYISKSF